MNVHGILASAMEFRHCCKIPPPQEDRKKRFLAAFCHCVEGCQHTNLYMLLEIMVVEKFDRPCQLTRHFMMMMMITLLI